MQCVKNQLKGHHLGLITDYRRKNSQVCAFQHLNRSEEEAVNLRYIFHLKFPSLQMELILKVFK